MSAFESGTAATGSHGSGTSGISTNVKMEALLEQLRAKHTAKNTPNDSWNEFAKQIRMASLDNNKRRGNDPGMIEEALGKLQSVMSANNLAQLLERISSACQKLGLKYSEQGNTVYISMDLFYIDLQCDLGPTNQAVRDVRVAHHGSSQPSSVPSMTQALRQGNVKLFMDHLKGFMDMYNMDIEQSVKTKFFIVQQSLESDIEKINKVQLQQSKNITLGFHIYKLPLGLVQPRNGGLPTKLTFFITPYDFLNESEQKSIPMTQESIQNLDLGVSATVGIEQSSTNHQLQTIPLSNYTRSADNRLGTQFVQSTNINSVMMPAAFVLKFKKPIALSQQMMKQIERLQGSCTFSDSVTLVPMLDAVVESGGVSIPPSTRHFTVVLPGHVQNYYINEPKTNGEATLGGLVTKLPFTHPTFIPPVLGLLRQQLMLNTMMLSCVRSASGLKGETKPVNMELKVVTNQLLTVSFKHPFADSVATVDFDINDVSSPKCSIFCNAGDICTNGYASKVVQRSFSIPITMRAILKQVGHQEENMPPPDKRVKVDHGEIMQQICNVYTSRGHYLPYGSVNTSSTSYTKNIQTNKYRLCLRRFSGYRRSCFTRLNHVNSIPVSLTKPLTSVTPPVPSQAIDKLKVVNNPMLSSLLDEKESSSSEIKPPVHPLRFEPTQTTPHPQYSASILSNLLEGSGGLTVAVTDKKPKRIRQKRKTSEGPSSGSSQPAGGSSPAQARKRKKSDNDEIVRELTSKVKSEVSEQQALAAANAIPQPRMSAAEMMVVSSVHTTGTSKSPVHRSVPPESHLAQLLHTVDDDRRGKPAPKPKIVMAGDLFESALHMKQEALQAEVKGPTSVTIKTVRPKKSEDRKIVKQSVSADSASRDRKLKRSDSAEMKMKESRSLEQMPSSPSRKIVKVISAKSKVKPQVKSEPVAPLSIRTFEDRSSPREKVKKQSSEKEKKKRAPKSPVSIETPVRQLASDKIPHFYGNRSIMSLPKIPKRKPGENQASPTSPKSLLSQKSPSEWQRSSPVLNRSLPSKSEEPNPGSVNRTKSFPPPGDAKKTPLLPTPAAHSTSSSSQRAAQRKANLTEILQKQALSGSATQSSQSRQIVAGGRTQIFDPSPNSPDEMNIAIDSQPVRIPTQPVGNNPASPTPEAVTQAPKAIPLDPNKPPSSSTSHKSILVKQKAVSRPLTFSPNPSTEVRVNDDVMNIAL